MRSSKRGRNQASQVSERASGQEPVERAHWSHGESRGDQWPAPCPMCRRNLRLLRWLAIGSILLLALNLVIAGAAGTGLAG